MNKYMEEANQLAKNNLITNYGGPFGACIVKNDEIISVAGNEVLKNNDPTAHAEINAIRLACQKLKTYDLSDCVLYTTCYPCPMCLGAIIWANIKEVYYGNTPEDADAIGFRDQDIYDFINNKNSLLKMNNIDRDETIKVFLEYQSKNDKIIY